MYFISELTAVDCGYTSGGIVSTRCVVLPISLCVYVFIDTCMDNKVNLAAWLLS